MKHYRHDTGVYEEPRTRLEGNEIPEYLSALNAWATRHNEYVRQWAGQFRAFAEECLNAWAEDSSEWGECARTEAETLTGLLREYERLSKSRTRADATQAAYLAMEAGRYYERLLVRKESPHLRRGQKIIKAAREGHAARHGSPEEKAARWANYVRRFNVLRKERPNLSRAELYRRVAKEFGVSAKSIEGAVKRQEK